MSVRLKPWAKSFIGVTNLSDRGHLLLLFARPLSRELDLEYLELELGSIWAAGVGKLWL